MGAVLTQRPDLARAVVAAVPVLDSLRSETSTNGVYNITEFGTVSDPEHFAALMAYSPYHHVADQTSYPAVLLTAGEHDTRVDAWHAKKMTARLQEATRSEHPILLRMEAGGHLEGSLDQTIEESTDIYSLPVRPAGSRLSLGGTRDVASGARARLPRVWSVRSENSLLSICSRDSVLSIGSSQSFASFGSVWSFASAGSIGSAMSAASLLSYQSSGSVLSHQANGSLLSSQADRAVRGRRSDGPLPRGVVAAGVLVSTIALLWHAYRRSSSLAS